MTKLFIPVPVLLNTQHDIFQRERFALTDRKKADPRDFSVNEEVTLEGIPEDALDELLEIAGDCGAKKFVKTLEAIRADGAESGWKVPSFEAFEKLIGGYLRAESGNGWLWCKGRDGRYLPYAVTDISYVSPDRNRYDSRPFITISGSYWGQGGSDRSDKQLKLRHDRWSFYAGDVTNRKIPSILAAMDIRVGDDAILEAWHQSMANFDRVLSEGFAQQFRITGPVAWANTRSAVEDDAGIVFGHRAICDTDETKLLDNPLQVSSKAMGSAKDPVDIDLPRHPIVQVFDLSTHEGYAISTDNIEWYRYDHGLRDKLILPETHSDMLDVLTTDIEALTEDVIEGKSAGNIILAKGPAGTGKTLMAEVYSELMEKPLYRLHAGTLGTTAEAISKSLTEVFRRAARWNCALLIDEADVFVMTRGDDIERNAVTAEFLRTLEYFPGMIFMTTNRPHDIDEAVLSRCAAVLHFDRPTPENALRIWRGQAENFGYDLEDTLARQLVETYHGATGRDIKQLMRQSLRYAAKRTDDGRITADIVRKVAVFRGMDMTPAAEKEAQVA